MAKHPSDWKKGNSDSRTSVRRAWGRGNMATSLNHLNDNARHAVEKHKKSKKGRYNLLFSRMYTSVTEKEIELREQYTRSLLSAELGVPEEYFIFEQKEESISNLSLTEVYYVIVGSHVYGKISIRVQRFGSMNNLYFLFQSKSQSGKSRR